ncbi:hypothetical protein CP98_02360 [Sphingobium yanoikuyae]|uniref:Uncharacterized protein n=1 Tax=Sphingobium yanoikuyae TaxID=13690 RepID=A0A084EL07_SPHYA|nr:hypothetical protein CP98_02360 [Sphingobium yanoikuyae]
MAQAFLHAGEHGLVVAGFEIDHAIGCKACLGDRWREEVGARDAPKDLALRAGGDPGAEEGGSGSIDRAVAAAGDLMQGAERESSAG